MEPDTVLLAKIPERRQPERRYLLEVVLGDYLGLDFGIQTHGMPATVLSAENGSITLPDTFFAAFDGCWLQAGSADAVSVETWTPPPEMNPEGRFDALPVMFVEPGSGKPSITVAGDRRQSNIDLLGIIFYLLTRYEEVVIGEDSRDAHGRLRASASLAGRNGFLQRPIVDVYVELLWCLISDLWPGLKRRSPVFECVPTHDVDRPFEYADRGMPRVGKQAAGDLLKRRSPSAAARRLTRYGLTRMGRVQDRFDRFDWLMAQSEAAGVSSRFFFKAGGGTAFDHPYDLAHPLIQSRMAAIHERGHEIGFHPSYAATGREGAARWHRELADLRRWSPGPVTGGRHHYLRYDAAHTWPLWEAGGLAYDSSLGYAEQSGFRASTCRSFPVFDLLERRTLKLREYPVAVMDATLFGYQGVGNETIAEEAFDQVAARKRTCREFGGQFVFIWHNNRLFTEAQRELYRWVLRG